MSMPLVSRAVGRISCDLEVGTAAAASECQPLKGNRELCFQGCKLAGKGFLVDAATRARLIAENASAAGFIRTLIAGSDVTKTPNEGLVSVLKTIHDDLDAAVLEAYEWPVTLSDDEILERLVALNHERAAEKKRGLVRWLRPEFQNRGGESQLGLAVGDDADDAEAEQRPMWRRVSRMPRPHGSRRSSTHWWLSATPATPTPATHPREVAFGCGWRRGLSR